MAKRRKATCRGCGRRVGHRPEHPAIELTYGPTVIMKPACLTCTHDFFHRLGVELWESGTPERMADGRDGYHSWCREAGVEPRPGPWGMADSAHLAE